MENTSIITAKDMPQNLGDLYVSFTPETDEQKASLYKAMSQPDRKMSDFINTKIKVVDLYVEIVEIADEQTGEMSKLPRVVLFTEDGTTYASISKGVFNAIKRLCTVYGMPHWEKPIPLKIIQTTAKNRKFLNLIVEP